MDTQQRIVSDAKIVIRPAPDRGVTVNGVGVWPDGPKDKRGYAIGTNGRLTAYYNFKTKEAEIIEHDDDENNSHHVIGFILAAAFFGFLCFIYYLFSFLFG